VKEENSRDIVEKKSAINLLVAFAIATKHYLREEYSYDYDDLRQLIGHMHRFHTPSSVKPMEKQTQAQQTQITADEPPPPAPTTPLPPEDNDAGTAKEAASKEKGKGKDTVDKGKNIEMSIRSKKKSKKGPKVEDPERGVMSSDSEPEIKIRSKKPKIVKAQSHSSTTSVKSEKAYKWKAHDIATPTNIPIELR
jgi:hypothetical protein